MLQYAVDLVRSCVLSCGSPSLRFIQHCDAMHRRSVLVSVAVALLASLATALPVTLLEDAKAADQHLDNKVKRSHIDDDSTLNLNAEENSGAPVAYFSNPSASKRASNLNTDASDETISEWVEQQQQQQQQQKSNPLKMVGYDDNPFEDKTIAEYEKGFHYGTNKAKLDEQMENAILKSEMYGDPASINQYRYYGGVGSDDRRRKRSHMKRSASFANRYKREVELSPEDILTLLSLWDEDRLRQSAGYRTNWPRYNPDLDLDNDREENEIDDPDETWLESPVYPGVQNPVHISPFAREFAHNQAQFQQPPIFAQKRQWAGFSDKKRKRFMVARKRSDPTRELRYLNGPAQSHEDLYTLTQLLGPPPARETGFPMYHRMGL